MSKQENHRQPNFIPPLVDSDNETRQKERGKARDSPEELRRMWVKQTLQNLLQRGEYANK